ncbi:MAG: hypothetical protein JRN52_03905 [Nitrososphaerota archaeon]|nr:hypothetical protein [Nitrososphaerota archaeon]
MSAGEDRKEKTIGGWIFSFSLFVLISLSVILGALQSGQILAAEFFAVLGGVGFVIGVVILVHLARKKDWN